MTLQTQTAKQIGAKDEYPAFSFTNYLAIEFLECKGCANPSEEMIQYTEKLLNL